MYIRKNYPKGALLNSLQRIRLILWQLQEYSPGVFNYWSYKAVSNILWLGLMSARRTSLEFLMHRGGDWLFWLCSRVNTPSQILRNINSEKFKGFDALDNNSACTDGAPGATIIIKKVNRHGFTFSWIKAHVVAVRKALDIIHNTIQIWWRVSRDDF